MHTTHQAAGDIADAAWCCAGLTSVTLPHSLKNVGDSAFASTSLTSVGFRPPVSGSFITWVVGSSRNRANWQLTTVKYLRNVLCLVMALALERRDVSTVDPDGSREVFHESPWFNKYSTGSET